MLSSDIGRWCMARSVTIFDKKLSKITGSVSMGELGHLVVLVRPSNLAHSRCVFFAS